MAEGFADRLERDEWRRILIGCENAGNLLQYRDNLEKDQIVAAGRLLNALVAANRLLMDELDRNDPADAEDIDFDTDLRLLLDSGEGTTTTEGAP